MKTLFELTLSFHFERTVPISDLLRQKHVEIALTSETPIPANISVMTSRGLSFFDSSTIHKTPFIIQYEPPGGADWSVLQLQAQNRREGCDSPFEVTMKAIEKSP